MSKKAFHPGSYANQKRIHEAEARAEAKRKHDEETLAQYQKEQELFQQRSLVSRESKDKLSLSFMYDAPPGIAKNKEGKNSEELEWTGTKPTSSNSSVASKINATDSSKLKTSDSGTTSKIDSNICLEWKRERPAKRPPKTTTQSQEIKKEPKEEKPDVDIKLKREVLVKRESSSKHDDGEKHIKQESKRIKKEP